MADEVYIQLRIDGIQATQRLLVCSQSTSTTFLHPNTLTHYLSPIQGILLLIRIWNFLGTVSMQTRNEAGRVRGTLTLNNLYDYVESNLVFGKFHRIH